MLGDLNLNYFLMDEGVWRSLLRAMKVVTARDTVGAI